MLGSICRLMLLNLKLLILIKLIGKAYYNRPANI